jgi:hypothetical protein
MFDYKSAGAGPTNDRLNAANNTPGSTMNGGNDYSSSYPKRMIRGKKKMISNENKPTQNY